MDEFTPNYCGKCGSPLDANGVCPRCAQQQYPPVSYAAPQQTKKGGLIALIVTAFVLVFLLMGVAALSLLSYFDLVQVPVLSAVMNAETDDDDEVLAAQRVEKKSAAAKDRSAADDDVLADDAIEVSGVLREERYRFYGESGTVVILKMDHTETFHVDKEQQERFGSVLETNELQIEGLNFAYYEDAPHVTVSGRLRFAAEKSHRRSVILEDCYVRYTGADDRYNREHTTTTTTEPTTEEEDPQVRLRRVRGEEEAYYALREYPSDNADLVEKIPAKDESVVTLLEERASGWNRIKYHGSYGWEYGWCNMIPVVPVTRSTEEPFDPDGPEDPDDPDGDEQIDWPIQDVPKAPDNSDNPYDSDDPDDPDGVEQPDLQNQDVPEDPYDSEDPDDPDGVEQPDLQNQDVPEDPYDSEDGLDANNDADSDDVADSPEEETPGFDDSPM